MPSPTAIFPALIRQARNRSQSPFARSAPMLRPAELGTLGQEPVAIDVSVLRCEGTGRNTVTMAISGIAMQIPNAAL